MFLLLLCFALFSLTTDDNLCREHVLPSATIITCRRQYVLWISAYTAVSDDSYVPGTICAVNIGIKYCRQRRYVPATIYAVEHRHILPSATILMCRGQSVLWNLHILLSATISAGDNNYVPWTSTLLYRRRRQYMPGDQICRNTSTCYWTGCVWPKPDQAIEIGSVVHSMVRAFFGRRELKRIREVGSGICDPSRFWPPAGRNGRNWP